MSWASWIVAVLGVYTVIGLVFALAFAFAGAARIDPAARGAPLGFKLLMLPASVALWPILARRWLAGQSEPPTENNAHRAASRR